MDHLINDNKILGLAVSASAIAVYAWGEFFFDGGFVDAVCFFLVGLAEYQVATAVSNFDEFLVLREGRKAERIAAAPWRREGSQ